jgi:hypothetical protein
MDLAEAEGDKQGMEDAHMLDDGTYMKDGQWYKKNRGGRAVIVARPADYIPPTQYNKAPIE